MPSKLRAHWDDLMQGLWFVPGLVATAFALFAIVLLQIDRAAGDVDIFFGGSASAARTILSTIAASVITVAGLAFSITIITLQLVSQQFSPRATRTFLGNKPTQVSAGVFVGVFVYCLIVLRTVREEEVGDFVPGMAVTVAIALGVLGIGVLLFFINHTAQSIKVTSITSRIARETLSSIDSLYPEPYGEPVDEERPAEEVAAGWLEDGEPLRTGPPRPGFVERVDADALVDGLPDGIERVWVHVAPGEFVTEGQSLVSVWPREAVDADQVEDAVRDAILVASERDVAEDALHGIQQLADIALRAISPSVNDPTTAVTCVGYLAACLERLAGREFPPPRRLYREGALEIVVTRPDFDLFVAHAVDDVGRWAAQYPRVVKALLSAVARAASVAAAAGASGRVEALLAAARRVTAPALREAATGDDRDELEEALDDVMRARSGRDVGVHLSAGARRPWSGRG